MNETESTVAEDAAAADKIEGGAEPESAGEDSIATGDGEDVAGG